MRIKDSLLGLMQVFRIHGGALALTWGKHPTADYRAAAGRDDDVLTHPLHQRLKRYENELRELRVENEYLRMSATTFGELAERLNRALKDAGGRGRTPVPKGG